MPSIDTSSISRSASTSSDRRLSSSLRSGCCAAIGAGAPGAVVAALSSIWESSLLIERLVDDHFEPVDDERGRKERRDRCQPGGLVDRVLVGLHRLAALPDERRVAGVRIV